MIRFVPAPPEKKEEVVALLASQRLPVNDLDNCMNDLIIAMSDDEVLGVIGVEVYGANGLLRSLAVDPVARNRNIAGELVNRLEERCRDKGIDHLYLLTETAEGYFLKKGFQRIERGTVPEAVKASTQFSHVCPSSATVMKKNIRL